MDSVVMTDNLATIQNSEIAQGLGTLVRVPGLMAQVDAALSASLGL